MKASDAPTTSDSYESPSSLASATGPKDAAPKSDAGKVQRVEIEFTDNGGFVATSYKKPTGRNGLAAMMSPSKHSFDNYYDLEGYLADLAGVKDEEKDNSDEGDTSASPDASDAEAGGSDMGPVAGDASGPVNSQ